MIKLSFEGSELTLTQNPHCEVPLNAHYDWMAAAVDSQGNDFFVFWSEINGFDGDDCSNACDWQNPIGVIAC